MENKVRKNELLFLVVCLGLAILAEWSFFHGIIGVSYLVFISGFYLVFFIRFRTVSFTHRRIGLLLMLSIWLLSMNYLVYDSTFLYLLNIVVIPFLVFVHMVLITAPKQLEWYRPRFVRVLFEKIAAGVRYNITFLNRCFTSVFKQMDDRTAYLVKRIVVGLVIGVPLLGVVTLLLMSADAVFQDLVGAVPNFIFQLNFQEQLIRIIIVLFFLVVFFGIFQVLTKPRRLPKQQVEWKRDEVVIDGVITLTVLLLLNAVYLLFTVIQFTYFFGSGLEEGYTYAEYARKGFFELVVVTILNWTILIASLTKVKVLSRRLNIALKVMYSILVAVSGVMLASAYLRLSLYESAYGFTFDRILAHAFMLYLFVVFAYTFIRIWLEKVSLLHFYLISSLLFYTALNIVPLNQIIVTKNIERYQETERIDIDYLNRLSYTGVNGLIDLYHQQPEYPELKEILERRKQSAEMKESNWQSFNVSRQRVKERLLELELD